jgi:hypothetical protein
LGVKIVVVVVVVVLAVIIVKILVVELAKIVVQDGIGNEIQRKSRYLAR